MSQKFSHSLRRRIIIAGAAVAVLTIAATARAERPSATKLLPIETVAFVQIADAPELAERFLATGFGRMGQDPKLKPLIGALWGTAVKELAKAEEELGVSIPEILKIPQGEVALALIGSDDARPSVVVLLDCGTHVSKLEKIIERGVQEIKKNGGRERTEMFLGTRLYLFDLPGNDRRAVYAKKEGTIIASNNLDVLKGVLAVWAGKAKKDAKQLADNRAYIAVMKQCGSGEGATPQLRWFVDPIALAKSATIGNPGAELAIAMLPTLGVDGIQGIGGTIALATEKYDWLAHVHLLLENPREGVLTLAAFKPADASAEPWVPDDVANYMTLNWDVQKTYTKLAEIRDSFQSEGAMSRSMQRFFKNRFEIDFEKELLPLVEGRFTYTSRFRKPATPNGQGHMLGIKLTDAKKAAKVLEKLTKPTIAFLEKKPFAGKTVYYVKGPDVERAPEDLRNDPPAFCILDDYLVAASQRSLLESAIRTSSDPSRSLADALDYKLISSKIRRTAGSEPVMVSFQRPDRAIRHVYDLVQSERVRTALANRREGNRFLGGVEKALNENPLPPFDVLKKYLSPGGSVLTDDPTGLHWMAFSLKRED
ncbi:MAG: DUF3352 domain-containing protein [Planctomycetes bacterium]|nr:DUF3352 domain-containing protein [Planctomycetota bacterium]